MRIKFHDKEWELPKIAQYQSYKYAAECCCPVCMSTNPAYQWLEENTKGIVGFCETESGDLMLCLECPHCFHKYRYHFAPRYNKSGFDVEYWKHEIGLIFFLDSDKDNEYEKFRIH